MTFRVPCNASNILVSVANIFFAEHHIFWNELDNKEHYRNKSAENIFLN